MSWKLSSSTVSVAAYELLKAVPKLTNNVMKNSLIRFTGKPDSNLRVSEINFFFIEYVRWLNELLKIGVDLIGHKRRKLPRARTDGEQWDAALKLVLNASPEPPTGWPDPTAAVGKIGYRSIENPKHMSMNQLKVKAVDLGLRGRGAEFEEIGDPEPWPGEAENINTVVMAAVDEWMDSDAALRPHAGLSASKMDRLWREKKAEFLGAYIKDYEHRLSTTDQTCKDFFAINETRGDEGFVDDRAAAAEPVLG